MVHGEGLCGAENYFEFDFEDRREKLLVLLSWLMIMSRMISFDTHKCSGVVSLKSKPPDPAIVLVEGRPKRFF